MSQPLEVPHSTAAPDPVHPRALQEQAPFAPDVATQLPPGKASGAPQGTHVSENAQPLTASQVPTMREPLEGRNPEVQLQLRVGVNASVGPSHRPLLITGGPHAAHWLVTAVSAGHPEATLQPTVNLGPK